MFQIMPGTLHNSINMFWSSKVYNFDENPTLMTRYWEAQLKTWLSLQGPPNLAIIHLALPWPTPLPLLRHEIFSYGNVFYNHLR